MNIVLADSGVDWRLPVVREDGAITEILPKVPDSDDDPSEKSTVPVFSARLSYEGQHRRNTHSVRHLFRDEQTGMVYRFSPKTMEALQNAILSGDVKVDTDAQVYEGLFTFVVYTKWVFATPLSRIDRARLKL